MTSIFTKIVRGEIPCHKVWEDEEHLAFLDIQPWAEGHTLVIPKKETDYIFDLSVSQSEALWVAAHKVAKLLEQKINCQRVAVLVLGYEVPHAHIHLIPTQSEAQVLRAQRQPTDHSGLAQLASRLRGESEDNNGELPNLPTTDAVENRWDQFAHSFVSQVEHTSLKVAKAGIDHLQLETATAILEIGCGGGGAGVEMWQRLRALKSMATLTLTDISSEMIQITQDRFAALSPQENLKICKADAQQLPFEDASFDRIFSCLNLMLVPDPLAMIKECARVLKPNGLGIWIVWGRPEHSHMMTLTPQALRQVGIELPPVARSNFHLGGRETLKNLLEDHGFEKVRRWYQPMMANIETGEDYAKMSTSLRPELAELCNTDEQCTQFKQALVEVAQDVLEQGEGIGLDALLVVARKKAD